MFLVVLSAVAACVAGCDTAGVGASGVISLGPAVDASAFTTLAMRVFENPSGAFEPGQPTPNVSAIDQPLAPLTFPYPYRIGGEINKLSDQGSWMFVAWLSHRDRTALKADPNGIDPGDVFCAVPFHPGHCWDGTSYCDIKPGVDCTVAEVVPTPP